MTLDQLPAQDGPSIPAATPADATARTIALVFKRRFWLWPALLTLAICLAGITGPQLWEDELVTWSMVTRETGQLWATLGNVDSSLGTYYVFL
ncbi:MAG: hypothetical protein LBV60_12340, partial [Streptomyces sp.]|nr:hypothetical protein [Streptomyces sp.]